MKTKVLHFITLIVLLFIITGITYAENLIKNPSFEELTADDKPLNWRTHSWTQDAAVQFGIDKGIAYSGKNSAFVHNSIDNHGYYIQTVTVNENSSYKISGWIKTEGIGTAPLAEGAGISIINFFEVGGNFKGSVDWSYAELYVTTGSGISSIEVMLQVGNYGGLNIGKAWFDEITMTKVNSVPPDAVISVVSLKKDSSQPDTEPGAAKDTSQETKNQGTFFFFIIVIIVVVLAGIAVVIIIIVTRKKPGKTDENAKDEPGEETQEPETEDKTEEDK